MCISPEIIAWAEAQEFLVSEKGQENLLELNIDKRFKIFVFQDLQGKLRIRISFSRPFSSEIALTKYTDKIKNHLSNYAHVFIPKGCGQILIAPKGELSAGLIQIIINTVVQLSYEEGFVDRETLWDLIMEVRKDMNLSVVDCLNILSGYVKLPDFNLSHHRLEQFFGDRYSHTDYSIGPAYSFMANPENKIRISFFWDDDLQKMKDIINSCITYLNSYG